MGVLLCEKMVLYRLLKTTHPHMGPSGKSSMSLFSGVTKSKLGRPGSVDRVKWTVKDFEECSLNSQIMCRYLTGLLDKVFFSNFQLAIRLFVTEGLVSQTSLIVESGNNC